MARQRYELRLHGFEPGDEHTSPLGTFQEDGPGNDAWQRAQRLGAMRAQADARKRRN